MAAFAERQIKEKYCPASQPPTTDVRDVIKPFRDTLGDVATYRTINHAAMKKLIVLSGIVVAVLMLSFEQRTPQWNADTPLYEVLFALGEPKPKHYIEPTAEQVKVGEEIVLEGNAKGPDGRRPAFVSKYYKCTTCHNIQREDPDLRHADDPEARLPYVKAQGIPLLQGTTFWGIVNRESWYNEDYVNKYGDEKIAIAHEDLRESIQLCAIECSQGRPMKDWEVEAVLAYYWSLQYKMGDLDMSDADWARLKNESSDAAAHDSLRTWLKSFYLQTSPATFYDAPRSKVEGYPGLAGNAERGKDIYELSCLWCHNGENGVSHYVLDNSKLSFKHLNRMMTKDSHFSLYQIVAYGTYSLPGRRPYMPHYPEEKLSKQQVEDLRAYIEQQAR